MKKTFTLIAAGALALSAQAADYQLIHNGVALENGATYEAGYETSAQEIVPGVMTLYTVTYDTHLMLKADPSTQMTIEVKGSPTEVQFCGFDNQCIMCGPTGASKTGFTKTAEPEDLLIDVAITSMSDYQYLAETDVVTVTAYPTANPADKTTVTIQLVNKPAGTEDIIVDNDGPVQYYNISGQPIDSPAPGQTVIRRQGSKAEKIFVK